MSRYFVNSATRWLVLGSGTISFLVLLFIFLFILVEAIPSLRDVGPVDLLFGTTWSPAYGKYGLLPLAVGSILSTLIAIAIAVPLSLSTAIYLAEIASPRVQRIARPTIDLLIGIPSVVYGLVGLMFLAPIIGDIDPAGGSGRSVLTAGIVLAVMILPTVAGISEDRIRSVPGQYREASSSLGATHWQTIWHVLLPAARPGIIAAVILGIGRAIGETMAMIMVIGNMPGFPTSIFQSAYTLTGAIAQEAGAAFGTHRSALFTAGLVLFVLVLLVNMAAIYAHRRMAR